MNQETAISKDYSLEMRATYLGAFPHTIITSLIWLISGYWGAFHSKPQSIMMFIIGGTLIFPFGELLRKMMRVQSVLSEENKLPKLFTLLAFSIPLSYPLIYLIIKHDINLFYSSFTILIGAHYLPFIYGYGMKTFGVLSILLIATGTYYSLNYTTEFELPALSTGIILMTFGMINYYLVKKKYYESKK